MILIDGSTGEGGGQILRSSLALSMATGRPFRLSNIRAGRPKPGLMRQHLTCVQAAAAICGGTVTGATVGSREISFFPGPVRAGAYHFAIGTAGGTALVAQAVLPALLRADGPSTVTIEGGTHNLAAPPYEFMERALFPLLARAGAYVAVRLERHGFYPAGGGRIVLEVAPAADPKPLELLERGERLSARAMALVSRLPRTIAVRELEVLRDRVAIQPGDLHVVDVPDPVGPGNAAWVEVRYEHVTEVFSAVGQIDKPAERVAREISDEFREYAAARRPVGVHLADQLMVPLAMLAGGRYATGPLSEHARTNILTMGLFGCDVECEANGVVRVAPLRIS